MKTYYDLKDNELKGYNKEFRKTEQGKKMNIVKILMYTLYVLLILLEVSIMSYINTPINEGDYLISILNKIDVIVFIAAIIYEVYYNVSFTFWLKNKHQISRW